MTVRSVLGRGVRLAGGQAQGEGERVRGRGDVDDARVGAGVLRRAYQCRPGVGGALAERLFEQVGPDMAAEGLR